MKRIFAVVLALVLVSLSTVIAFADADYKGLNGFYKSSRSDFVGKGGLTQKKEVIETFDSPTAGINYNNKTSFDSSNKKEGSSSLKFTASGGVYSERPTEITKNSHDVFSGYLPKSYNITNPMAQTLGLWFYVEDIDKLPCDHDDVYDKFQQDCGTIYMRFGYGEGNYQQWNHTFYGDGWHYIEFAFNSKENSPEGCRANLIYQNLSYMRFVVFTQGQEITINLDELSIITYNTTAETPEAPGGGTWLTTGDYNVFDGATVTEWMGAYFDTENKTQGVSSLMLHGRKEHVDFREVVCGFNGLPINVDEDVFCVDIYVEDMKLVGSDWSFSFYDLKEKNSLVAKFSHLASCTVSDDGRFSNGWNTVRIPFKAMTKSKDFTEGDFEFDRLKIYCSGGSETEYYNIGYDNMYIVKASELKNIPIQNFGKDGGSSSSGNYLAEQNKDKTSSEEEPVEEKGLDTMVIVAICAIGGAVLLVVVLLIVILAVKKKKAAPKKAVAAPKKNPSDKNESEK